MKVGTDGVLLGAWAPLQNQRIIYDLGSGTGLLSLMMAQRSNAQIQAFEFDGLAAEQAQKNFQLSEWSGRLSMHTLDVFGPGMESYCNRADLVVCNPPFYDGHVLPPSASRAQARHTQEGGIEKWIALAYSATHSEGSCAFILPFAELNQFRIRFSAHQWSISQFTSVFPSPGKGAVRALIYAQKKESIPIESNLFIENGERGKYHPDYIGLTKAFYLNMPD